MDYTSGLIQKDIQDIMTIRQVGMYVWNMKYPRRRLKNHQVYDQRSCGNSFSDY